MSSGAQEGDAARIHKLPYGRELALEVLTHGGDVVADAGVDLQRRLAARGRGRAPADARLAVRQSAMECRATPANSTVTAIPRGIAHRQNLPFFNHAMSGLQA